MENLRQAKKEYKKGEYFFSATGKIKTPIKITYLRKAENIYGDIVNEEGGVIYCSQTNTWAKKCKKNS